MEFMYRPHDPNLLGAGEATRGECGRDAGKLNVGVDERPQSRRQPQRPELLDQMLSFLFLTRLRSLDSCRYVSGHYGSIRDLSFSPEI